jgi:hypothetical protein
MRAFLTKMAIELPAIFETGITIKAALIFGWWWWSLFGLCLVGSVSGFFVLLLLLPTLSTVDLSELALDRFAVSLKMVVEHALVHKTGVADGTLMLVQVTLSVFSS